MSTREEVKSYLSDYRWETSYRHEDGDLVRLFYVPALSCAERYDRTTGYFSADALALASRGVERLIANRGTMRMIVGCTLAEDEAIAIARGYDLREAVERNLLSVRLEPPDLSARNGLEALAWMIAHQYLNIKVALPTDPEGNPVSGLGLFHEKSGVILDRRGDLLAFSGSVNETAGGWLNNRESFHVHLSWEGGRDIEHVNDEVEAFERLWNDGAASVKVLEFPEAAKLKLLEFMPRDDRFDHPPIRVEEPSEHPTRMSDPISTREDVNRSGVFDGYSLSGAEARRIVWTYIQNSARAWNGIRVGEATSTVDPWPHQVRTYQKLIREWPCRRLIADEVGLGKTITAGLFIRQARLAGLAKRILILAPRSLAPQWQGELYEKFNFNVPIYDGSKLIWHKSHAIHGPIERAIGRNEWHKESFVIASSHLMRRSDRAEELLAAEAWDLVVLDEAHHARRKAPGSTRQGGANRLLRLMIRLSESCRSLLLLTATPMQVAPIELWDLLRLLGMGDRWGMNGEGFLRYFAEASGNPSKESMEYLCEMFRETERVFGETTEERVETLRTGLNDLEIRKVLKALRDRSSLPMKRLDSRLRTAALEVLRRVTPVSYLMHRHTRGLLREYHQRGMLDSPIARREIVDEEFEMNDSERELYDALGAYITQTYKNASAEKRSATGFVLTIYRKRSASSFEALRKTLIKRLNDIDTIDDDDAFDFDDDSPDFDDTPDFDDHPPIENQTLAAEERAAVLDLLKKIERIGVNTKERKLMKALDDGFQKGYTSAIIFTQYSDTMNYLKDCLVKQYPGETVACYSGKGGKVRERSGLWSERGKEGIKRLLKEGSIKILVCTDAAAEGLNFQSCGLLINYDLPWNPMRVEQRIGRIDRIGQRYSTIRVVNLAYEKTVEADVYLALGNRIHLFEHMVGRLQPILSRLPGRFESTVLEGGERSDDARRRLVDELERSFREAEDSAIDLDAMSADAFETTVESEPSLDLDEIDRALNDDRYRPPSLEWKKLDPRSYSARLPGMKAFLRATTSAEVFDDHIESLEFLSPGGELFERISAEEPRIELDIDRSEDEPGRLWASIDRGTGVFRFWANRGGGIERCDRLSDLLDSLERDHGSIRFDKTLLDPDEIVHRLG